MTPEGRRQLDQQLERIAEKANRPSLERFTAAAITGILADAARFPEPPTGTPAELAEGVAIMALDIAEATVAESERRAAEAERRLELANQKGALE